MLKYLRIKSDFRPSAASKIFPNLANEEGIFGYSLHFRNEYESLKVSYYQNKTDWEQGDSWTDPNCGRLRRLGGPVDEKVNIPPDMFWHIFHTCS
jgi:hypothetical protein